MADVSETRPVKFPSTDTVRKLSIVAAGLTAAAVATQAAVAVAQQLGKSKEERAGLEGAVRMTIAVALAKAVPSILTEIRTISRELQR